MICRLSITKNVRPPRRQPSSRNPIKSLSTRSTNSYTDSIKVTLRPTHRKHIVDDVVTRPCTINFDNNTPTTTPSHHRRTQLADEAVRALEAIEDYSTVQLKSINAIDDRRDQRLLIQFRGMICQ